MIPTPNKETWVLPRGDRIAARPRKRVTLNFRIVAWAVMQVGIVCGAFVADSSLRRIYDIRAEDAYTMKAHVGIVVAAAVLSAGMWIWALRRWVLTYIEDLGRGARQIAEGRLDWRMAEDEPDERGEIARAFNNMAEALRENERRLRGYVEALDQLGDMVMTMDLQCNVTFANRELMKSFGYSQEELTGKSHGMLWSPGNPEGMGDTIREKSLAGGWRGVMIGRRKDGLDFPVELKTTPVLDSEGKVTGIVSVCRDITEDRKRQAQLVQTGKLVSLGTLAAGVAHELNQPLMVIQGYAQLLLMRNATDGETKDFLKSIEEGCHRMNRIIGHLREFAHMGKPESKPVDLNQVVHSTLILLGQQMKDHSIEVETKLADALPRVIGDANKLEQVLVNLLTNAKDALDRKGGGKVGISSGVEGDRVVVRVTDDGPGIPPDVAPRIFDPFFTTKEVGKGTGLGLSIGLGIAEEHGGTLTAGASPEGGAEFALRLPVTRPNDDASAVASAKEGNGHG